MERAGRRGLGGRKGLIVAVGFARGEQADESIRLAATQLAARMRVGFTSMHPAPRSPVRAVALSLVCLIAGPGVID